MARWECPSVSKETLADESEVQNKKTGVGSC